MMALELAHAADTRPDREEARPAHAVRRNTRLLTGAQICLWGALGTMAAFGPLSMSELTGRGSGSATLFGLYYLAAAAGALAAGRAMDRLGRRPGLVAGYLVLAAAGGTSFLAVAAGSGAGVLGAGVLFGVGAAAALLGRGAVAEMYPPERRGRAVGRLVVAGTAGAVGAPPLAGLVHGLAERLGASEPLAVPWLLVPLLSLIAAAMMMALRPDPRALAVDAGAPSAARRPWRTLRLRPAAVAVATIGVAQAVMVTFMSVIPVVLHHHGAGELTVSIVVSIHLAGMFAFSSVLGSAIDRFGRRWGLLAAVLLSAAGVLVSSVVRGTASDGAALLLIGVGWSAAYLSSTAIVSDLASPADRAAALGTVDLVAAVAAGVGVLGGAAVLQATDIRVLGFAALGLLALSLLAVVPLGEPTRGRSAPTLPAPAPTPAAPAATPPATAPPA